MTPKQKAQQLYQDAFMRWCYELSHEKNVATAKNAAAYVCEEIIGLEDLSVQQIAFWKDVKKEVYKIRG